MVEFAHYTRKEFSEIERARASLCYKAKNEKRKTHKNAYMRAYSATQECRARLRAREQTPERKAYMKAYRATPKCKAYERARSQTTERKAYKKAYKQLHTNAINARRRELYARKKADATK